MELVRIRTHGKTNPLILSLTSLRITTTDIKAKPAASYMMYKLHSKERLHRICHEDGALGSTAPRRVSGVGRNRCKPAHFWLTWLFYT